MPVTYAAPPPNSISIHALAEHSLRQGDEVRCYTTPDGKVRARRVLPGEQATGEALHNVLGGLPVTVIVLRREGE